MKRDDLVRMNTNPGMEGDYYPVSDAEALDVIGVDAVLEWLRGKREPARTERNGIRFGNQPYEGGTFKGIREE